MSSPLKKIATRDLARPRAVRPLFVWPIPHGERVVWVSKVFGRVGGCELAQAFLWELDVFLTV
jgi:hypothetical protein